MPGPSTWEAILIRHDTQQCQIVTPNLFTMTQDDVCDGWLFLASASGTNALTTGRDLGQPISIPANYTHSTQPKRPTPPVGHAEIYGYTIGVCNAGNDVQISRSNPLPGSPHRRLTPDRCQSQTSLHRLGWRLRWLAEQPATASGTDGCDQTVGSRSAYQQTTPPQQQTKRPPRSGLAGDITQYTIEVCSTGTSVLIIGQNPSPETHSRHLDTRPMPDRHTQTSLP